MSETFEASVRKVYTFLESSNYPYLVIGGLAASVLGEPRLTGDFDVLLFIKSEKLNDFIDIAQRSGFAFDRQRIKTDASERSCFGMKMGTLHVDCLLASTVFEFEVLQRKIMVSLGSQKIAFPSPEDLIVLKLLIGRDKDMLDVKNVAARHAGRLDVAYIKKWIKNFSESGKNPGLGAKFNKSFPGKSE